MSKCLNKIYYRVLGKKKISYNRILHEKIPNILNLRNNCSLVALHIAKPNLGENKIIEAFNRCANKWEDIDRNGITNSEFDQVLDFLKLHSSTKYIECKNNYLIIDFIKEYKNKKCVILIPGHFMTYTKNKFYDYFGSSQRYNSEKVLAIWVFI